MTEYPSGMGVNSLLAAKNFGVHKDNIIVGNGAAELIKSLMESFLERQALSDLHLKNILTDMLLKTKWYLHRQMIIIHIQLKN